MPIRLAPSRIQRECGNAAATARHTHVCGGQGVPNAQPLPPCRETYQYYKLPFCQPADGKEFVLEGLGEVLEGDRLVTTPYKLQFRTDTENQVLCKKSLKSEDLKRFREAVKQDYYFQVGWGTQATAALAACTGSSSVSKRVQASREGPLA